MVPKLLVSPQNIFLVEVHPTHPEAYVYRDYAPEIPDPRSEENQVEEPSTIPDKKAIEFGQV